MALLERVGRPCSYRVDKEERARTPAVPGLARSRQRSALRSSQKALWVDVDGHEDAGRKLHFREPGAEVGLEVDGALGVDGEAHAGLAANDRQWRGRRAPDVDAFRVGGRGREHLAGFVHELFLAARENDCRETAEGREVRILALAPFGGVEGV